MEKTLKVKEEFAKFLGKNVIVGFKNNTESEGKIETIDNYLNIVLTTENGIEVIKGEKVAFLSLKD